MSKERETFEKWFRKHICNDDYSLYISDQESLTYREDYTNDLWTGWQACAAHYQPLLEAKDAEIAALREARVYTDNSKAAALLQVENTVLKALLEQAREGFENIVMHISEMKKGAVTNQDGWFLRLSKQTLAAINAATGKGE